MGVIIENGGKVGGHKAEVNAFGQLSVQSTSEFLSGWISRTTQQAFATATGPMTLTSGATEYSVMVVENAESEKYFQLETIDIGWNGGSTNFNRMMYGSMYIGAGIPTTNILTGTYIPFGNQNFSSSKVTSVRAYLWDGVSTGLDGSAGNLALVQQFGPGVTTIDFRGATIIGPSQVLNFTATGTEAGIVTVTLSGYLYSPE